MITFSKENCYILAGRVLADHLDMVLLGPKLKAWVVTQGSLTCWGLELQPLSPTLCV